MTVEKQVKLGCPCLETESFPSWRLHLKLYVNVAVCGFTPFVWFILVYSHDEKNEMKIKMKQALTRANWFLHICVRESIEVWFYCVRLRLVQGNSWQ